MKIQVPIDVRGSFKLLPYTNQQPLDPVNYGIKYNYYTYL